MNILYYNCMCLLCNDIILLYHLFIFSLVNEILCYVIYLLTGDRIFCPLKYAFHHSCHKNMPYLP